MHLPLVALATLLGIQCVVAAFSAVSHQAAISEYFVNARRCVELNDCPSTGGTAGVESVNHGAAWIRLLSYSIRSGHDQTYVQHIVLGLLLLALAVTFFFIARYAGWRGATLALGLALPMLLVGTDFYVLNYPTLVPLPLALYYASLCLFIEMRRTVFAAVASMALAGAVSAQLGCIVMLPFLVLLVALTARPSLSAVSAVAVCCVAFAIAFCLDSMDAARTLVRHLPTAPFILGLAISAGAVVLAVRMSPQTLLPASTMATPDRIRALMTIALIYATTTVWLAGLLVTHKWPQPRYFIPAMFPAFYLLAERMRTLGTRATVAAAILESLCLLLLSFAPHGVEVLQLPVMVIVTLYGFQTALRQIAWRGTGPLPARSLWPAVALCLFAIAVGSADIVVASKRGPAQGVTLAEAEQLVRKLYSAGYTYPGLLGALRGPAADDLVPVLTDRDPNLFAEAQPVADENFSLLVVKVPDDAIARTRGVIAAVRIDDSSSAIVVRGERSYLDWLHVRRCRWRRDGEQAAAYGCMQPQTDQPLPHSWPFVAFGDSLPLSDSARSERASDQSVSFEVPVHTPGQGVPHIVRVTNEWPLTWRITRVSGVEFEGKLPGVEIRLPDQRKGSGVVEFELTAIGDVPWVWVPHVLEVTDDNEHLLEAFRNDR